MERQFQVERGNVKRRYDTYTLEVHNREPKGSKMVKWVKTDKAFEIQQAKAFGNVLSNAIDAGYQNSCLFTNKSHFTSPLWVLIGVLAQFYEKYH